MIDFYEFGLILGSLSFAFVADRWGRHVLLSLGVII